MANWITTTVKAENFETDRETFLNNEHQKYQETENLINSLF